MILYVIVFFDYKIIAWYLDRCPAPERPTAKKTFQNMVQSRKRRRWDGLALALLISAIDTQQIAKTQTAVLASNNDEAYPVVGVTMTSTFLKISMW